ncbi:MAG: hypothetical protein PQJ60_13375 [Spirochaetales bacterium]|nr:hypothetical protein [Spirochaetales bacterium]
MKKILLFSLIVLLGSLLGAEPVKEGWWTQTASTAGESAMTVAMKVTAETPRIISLDSNNGWLGYAWYDEEKDVYTGFFELIRPESSDERNDWTGEVFQIVLSFDGLTLTLQAESPERDFKATYWQK